MDKLQWFKFCPIDWMMGKIQRVPELTQSRYIRLICLYWNKECYLSYEDAEIEIDKEHLDILISKKIVKLTEGVIEISFLNEQFETIGETSEKRRKAANKRWNSAKQDNADVMQVHASALQNDAEKIREDKSRVEKKRKDKNTPIPDYPEFLLYAKEKEPKINEADLKLKYDSWVVNDWKDGNGNKIVNWKSKLLNTIPYMKKDFDKNKNQDHLKITF